MANEGKTKKPISTPRRTTTAKKKPTSTKKKPTSTKKKPTVVSKKKPTSTKKKPLASTKTISKKTVKTETKKKSVLKVIPVEPVIVLEEKQKSGEIKKRGKLFYLIFSIIFFTAAFFYINNLLDNNDYLETALFAFAALFVVFVFLEFNVHMLFVNFFRLPFIYLIRQSKQEIKKEKVLGSNQKVSLFNKYKALFTLTLYSMIILLLAGSQIYNGIIDGDKVLVIITQSFITVLVFLVIICSWQYLFNILPIILEKSIDAKNGFILTLSATVMIIYVVFNMFEIAYLSEMMIFVLIVGFIALLGVNLNMIVGEINIFQNLRSQHSATVTRAVFLIFFGFHLYVILYASVVAFSIYKWDENSFDFANEDYETVIVMETYDFADNPLTMVYDNFSEPITVVYDIDGNILTDFYGEDGEPITKVYDIGGNLVMDFFTQNGQLISTVYDNNEEQLDNFYYHDGAIIGDIQVKLEQNYGDFLYFTVVSVSTLGYGDITPSLDYNIAQVWGGFLSFYGFTFFALSIGFVSNIAIEGIVSSREDENDD